MRSDGSSYRISYQNLAGLSVRDFLRYEIRYEFISDLISVFLVCSAELYSRSYGCSKCQSGAIFCVIIGIKNFWPPADAYSDPLLLNSPYIKKDNLQWYYSCIDECFLQCSVVVLSNQLLARRYSVMKVRYYFIGIVKFYVSIY
jgi:hypothetical protein